MTHTPQSWHNHCMLVCAAVLHYNDTELAQLVSDLQRAWRAEKKQTQWDTLQALYAEQHRRRWA